MPRGGKRPGAGAPKGNLNAAKSGRYSRRLRAIAQGLATVPEVRDFLLNLNQRQRRAQRRAERIAFKALQDFLAEVPNENNPLTAYLRQSLAKQENQHTALN